MAKKRMFNLSIVDSDSFLDMPMSAQALYFHLNMRADDDGFVGNPKRVQRNVGASDDDLKILVVKRYLLVFEDGVIAIKHWRMHNTIQSDRYTPTEYLEERNLLRIKENKAYSLHEGVLVSEVMDKKSKRIVNSSIIECNQSVNTLVTDCNQDDSKMFPKTETDCFQDDSKMFPEMETKEADLFPNVETSRKQNDSADIGLGLGKGIDRVCETDIYNINNNNISEHEHTHTHTHTKKPEQEYYESLCRRYGREFVDIRVKRGQGYNGITWAMIGRWCEQDWQREQNAARAAPKLNQFNQGDKTSYDMERLERALLGNCCVETRG